MIFNREHETMLHEDLEQLQIERLQTTLNRIYRNVSFYRHTFDSYDINIEQIKTIKEVKELPFTAKDDLRKSYPYDMFAVPLKDIVRIQSTSGTTGKPIVIGYTKTDINIWASLVARVLTSAGITNQDFVQIAFNYSLNTAGFGFHYGAEKIGASVIPASSEDIHKQIMIIRDYKTTALLSTPGYALHIAAVLDDMNIHPEALSLRTGIFGAEPWSENLRSQIENQLHIDAYDNYGLSEILGPGVAFECREKQGLHVNEDHFIVEVVDPQTGNPVPVGEEGELVFTTITKQGFPLVRYRTGDISSLIPGLCPCGRTTIRMSRISGRTDDMIIVEGVNVFPTQIEEVLLQIKGIEPHYQLILRRDAGLDSLEIKVEFSEEASIIDEVRKIQDFTQTVQERINSELGINAKVTLVEPKSLSRSTGDKMKRIVDERSR